MKKIYRKLFELFTWLHLPVLAMKFYSMSVNVIQIGATKIYSNNPHFIETVSHWVKEWDEGEVQPMDDEFPF